MQVLRTQSLPEVRDGALAALLDQKIADAYADCADRPALVKDRTVTLTVKIKPTGESPMEAAIVDFTVASKIPAQGFARQMKASPKYRGLVFEADTDNADAAVEGQKTLDQQPE